MRVLALDTSSPATSCALVEFATSHEARVLADSLHEPPEKAGDLLPDALSTLCARAGIALADVEGIAVGLGPGSFTGLRVGLAAAKALAYARKLPLAGASSLEALALGARAAAQGARDGAALAQGAPDLPAVATLEARRGEVYASLEGVFAERVLRVPELASLLRTLPARPLLAGPGARANREALAEWELAEPAWPRAADVARLCAQRLLGARYDAAACFALSPNYLQPSLAEVALSEGRVGGLPKPQA